MTIGTSLVLVALGAILRWGVADKIEGVDLSVIGLILMVIGAIGFVIGIFLYTKSPDEEIEKRRL